MNKLVVTGSSLLIGTLAITAPAAAFAQSATLGVSANANVSTGSTSLGTGAHVGAGVSISKMQGRANQEIDRRITNLQNLSTRIGEMKKVSVDESTTLQADISAQISALTTLKAKIDADTDAATLKEDVKTIAKDYRVYMLVLPQNRIAAAADRVQGIVSMMQALEAKLQARISAAQSSGKDVSAANTAYADFQAKIADAGTQASAAVSETAHLQPDQGNSTVEASNTAALKDAKAKLQAAEADLKAARKDIGIILNVVKGTGSASVNASSTTSTGATVH